MEGILRILLLATILCGGDSSASGSIENQSFKNRYGGGNRPRPAAANINYNARPSLSYNRPLGYPEGVRFPFAGYTRQLPREKPPVPPIKSSYISKPYPDFVIRFKPTLYPAELPVRPAGPPPHPVPQVTYPPELPPQTYGGGGGGGGGGYNSPPQSYGGGGGGGYQSPASPPQSYGGYQQGQQSPPQPYERYEPPPPPPPPRPPVYQPPQPQPAPRPIYDGPPPPPYGANDKLRPEQEFQGIGPGPAPDIPINAFPGNTPTYFSGQGNDRVAVPPPGAILLVADEENLPPRGPPQEPPGRDNFNDHARDIIPPEQSIAYNPPGQEGILRPVQSSSPHDPVHHSPDKSDDFKPMYLFGPVYFPKDGRGASGERVDEGSSWAGSDASRVDNVNGEGEGSSIDKQDVGSSSFETAVFRQDADQSAISNEEVVVSDHPLATQAQPNTAKTTATTSMPSTTSTKAATTKTISMAPKKSTTAKMKPTTVTTTTTTPPRTTTLSRQKPMERAEKSDGNSSFVITELEAPQTKTTATTAAPPSDSVGHDVPPMDLVPQEVKQDTPTMKTSIKIKVSEDSGLDAAANDTSRPDLTSLGKGEGEEGSLASSQPSEQDEETEDVVEENDEGEGGQKIIMPHPPIYVTKVIQGPPPNGYPMRPHFLPPYYQASFLPFAENEEDGGDKKNDANEVRADVDEDNPPRTADGKPIFFNLPKKKPSRRNEDMKQIIHEEDLEDGDNEEGEPIRIAVQAPPPFIPMMGHMNGDNPHVFRGPFAFQDRHPPPLFQGMQQDFQEGPRPFATPDRIAQMQQSLPQSGARMPPRGSSAVGQMPHRPFPHAQEENTFPANQLRKSFSATGTGPQHEGPSASLNPNSLFPGFPLPGSEERLVANKWGKGSRQQVEPPHQPSSTISSVERPFRFGAKPEMSTPATDSHESRGMEDNRSTMYRQQGFRMQQKAGSSTSVFPSTTTTVHPTHAPQIRTPPSTTTHKNTSSGKMNVVKQSAVSVITPASNIRQPATNNTQRRRPGFKPYVARTYVTPTTYHPILSTVTTQPTPTFKPTMATKSPAAAAATTQGSSIVSALDNSLEFSESVQSEHVEPYGIESAADHESLVRVHEGESYPEVVPYGTRLSKIN